MNTWDETMLKGTLAPGSTLIKTGFMINSWARTDGRQTRQLINANKKNLQVLNMEFSFNKND
jgi:hypothetical protein